MDVLVPLRAATARDIWEKIPDAPTYSTIRKLLSVLEDKGHVKHRESGKSYVYSPTRSQSQMADSALRRMRDTFFGGSLEQVVTGLLNLKDTKLDNEELDRIASMIAEAKQQEERKAKS